MKKIIGMESEVMDMGDIDILKTFGLSCKKIIKNYKLSNHSKILDIGCGKAFLLYEIKKILPGIKILGTDISNHALKNSPKEIRQYLIKKDASKNFSHRNNYFDLVISLGCLRNLKIKELFNAISEIERLGKNI